MRPPAFSPDWSDACGGARFRVHDFTGVRVAVVNGRFAMRFYGSVNAVGKRFKQGGVTSAIRVDHDHRSRTLHAPRRAGPARCSGVLYTVGRANHGHCRPGEHRFSTRLLLVTSVRSAVRIAEPRAAIQRIAPLDDVFGDTSAQRRTQTWLLAALAGLALLMSLVGIDGVVSSVVAARTREIGIRVALGARAPEVVGLVFGEALSVAAIGGGVGLGGVLIVTGLMRHWPFDVGPRDPIAMLGSVSSVLAVAAVASILPARRAAAIDPIIALRLK